MTALLVTAAACNSIYDDYDDCTLTYRLTFRYDYNSLYADAFAHEVSSVAVYAFDSTGVFVKEQTQSGDALAADGYYMPLDLDAGRYTLVAWCGLDDGSFSVPQLIAGTSTLDDLTCTLQRSNGVCDSRIAGLYHGLIDVELPVGVYGEYDYVMPLTKDTNHLRVILQHLSGDDVDVTRFSFSLDDDNGLMAYDNSLLADEDITYRAWSTETGSAGIDSDDGTVTSVKVAMADLSTARMTAGHKMYLTIRNDAGDVVVHVPFIDYALLVKSYYQSMTDQEFLDRLDEWTMTFFLDDDDRWIDTHIYINSWRVVLSDSTL